MKFEERNNEFIDYVLNNCFRIVFERCKTKDEVFNEYLRMNNELAIMWLTASKQKEKECNKNAT